MKSIADIFKKYYLIIILIVLTLYVLIVLSIFIISYQTTQKNILILSSFIKSFSNKVEEDFNKKINYVKIIYDDLLLNIKKSKKYNADRLKFYLESKYKDKNFDIAFISEKGIIIDTSFKKELGLDLTIFNDAKKALIDVKENLHHRIDFPILDMEQNFHLYLLDYLPKQKKYIQISYKLDILNSIKKNFDFLNNIKNIFYDFNIIHFYDKPSYKFAIIGKNKNNNLNFNTLNKLLDENKYDLLVKSFYNFKMYKVFNFNINNDNPYGIAYILKVSLLYSKNFMLFFFFINISIMICLLFLYKYFYNRIKTKIIKPIEYLSDSINNSIPLEDSFQDFNIKEIKSLKKSYISHLENIKMRDFVEELIKRQDIERKNIYNDIHDTVLQELAYVLLQLQIKKEDNLANIIKSVNLELRNLLGETQTPFVYSNLSDILLELQDSFQKKYPNFVISIYIDEDIKHLTFDEMILVNFYKIVNEIINNSIKHSDGNEINIELNLNDSFIKLKISDNGKGFNLYDYYRKGHFGLMSIRERTYILNGDLKILSDKNGTRYFIDIPID